MAIISIPTSIGGVSIPGSLVNGPLGALFGNKYSADFLQYPRDLSSATRGHVIQFTINETQPMSYNESTETGISALIDKATELLQSTNLSLNPRTKKGVGTISLYIPDTMNFTYNAGYTALSLADVAKDVAGAAAGVGGKEKSGAAAKAVGAIGKAASIAISGATSNAAKLALATQGLAINPMQQLLFDGITFRTYQLAFTFTPYSKEEADTVTKIIKKFKEHAMPKITSNGSGMFFIVPSTFDIKFLFNGSENKNVNRVAESVIEGIDVSYSPNGWSTHSDGAPVQTTLTLSMKEIELVDRTKIQAGY